MNILSTAEILPILDDFKETAQWLAKRGWSEGAGGNMSVRLDLPDNLPETEFIELPVKVPHLADKALLLTGSGSKARQIGTDPAPYIGLYKINKTGSKYCWLGGNAKPSIELPAHCAIHNTLAQYRPKHRAILHTHPVNLIALCHLDGFDNGPMISDRILRLQSEARLILPEGIGFVEHELPGSMTLGIKSAEQVRRHHLVLWQYHGCLATGSNLSHAFDLLEVFEKSADIYWTLRKSGIDPAGISEAETRATLQAFGQLERYLPDQ